MPATPSQSGTSSQDDSGLVVMSFGEHLEELRRRIARAFLLMLVGVIVALFFKDDLMEIVSGPHNRAMGRIRALHHAERGAQGLTELRTFFAELPAEQGSSIHALHLASTGFEARKAEIEGMTNVAAKVDALTELIFQIQAFDERHSFYGRLTAMTGSMRPVVTDLDAVPDNTHDALARCTTELDAMDEVFAGWSTAGAGLVQPDWLELERRLRQLADVRDALYELPDWELHRERLQVLSYTEPFFTHLKICLLAGLLLALPWLTLEIWFFIAAGLYAGERKAVYPYIPLSMVAFFTGGTFAYWVLVPVGLGYLGGFGSPDVIEVGFRLSDYVSLIMTLMLAMGLVFQLPMLMVFLTRSGLVTTAWFRKYRKISILTAVVVGAMFTPPDPVTQLLMAGPLVVLYELGIWGGILLTRRAEKRRKKSSSE